MTITSRITSATQAMEYLEGCGFKLTERLPWGMNDSRQIMELFTEAAHGVFQPNPWTTNEAHARFYHQDLGQLSDKALWREVERARWIMVWHDDPGEWVEERMRVCQAELAKRQKKSQGK